MEAEKCRLTDRWRDEEELRERKRGIEGESGRNGKGREVRTD